MSKGGSDDLFVLIQSLDKAERAYFKSFALFSSKGKDVLHIKLFDIMCKQTRSDDEYYISELAISRSHLSFLKNHLHELILDALVLKNSDKNAEAELSHLLLKFDILIEKSLFKQSQKIMDRIKSVAVKNEKLLFLLTANKKELDGLRNIKSKDEINALHEEKRVLNKKIHHAIESNMFLDNAIFLQSSAGFSRTATRDEYLEVLKKNAESIFDGNEKNKLIPFEAMKNYYTAMSTYHYYYGDFKKSEKYTLKFLNWISTNSKRIHISVKEFGSALRKMIIVSASLKKNRQALSYIVQLRNLDGNKTEKSNLTKLADDIELSVRISLGDFLLAKKMIEYTKTISESQQDAVWLYRASYTHFGLGDHNRSLFYLNNILNSKKHEIKRGDVFAFAKIFQLFIHYELGNVDLIEHILRSTQRFFIKSGRMLKYEELVLKFIRNTLIANNSKKDSIESFKRFRSQLEVLADNPNEAMMLEYFDLDAWLQSKIENRSFAEVVRDKQK